MKSEKLLSYIGDIDPKFVNAAERKIKTTTQTTERSPRRILRFVPAAVCGVVALAALMMLVMPVSTPFGGFVIKAYAAEDNGSNAVTTVLQPNVDVILAEYAPSMSSFPGYPFTFDIEKGNYELQISVDWGFLQSWDPSTGVVNHIGNNTTIQKGTTLYWMPDTTVDLDEIQNAIITVKAVENGKTVGSQEIVIIYTDYMYKAKLGALETK
jgi:hypothetical protein